MFTLIKMELGNFIKTNFVIFLLSVLAFTCCNIAITITIANYRDSLSDQQIVSENFNGQTCLRITLSGEDSVYGRLAGDDYVIPLRKVFEELKDLEDIQYDYTSDGAVWFTTDVSCPQDSLTDDSDHTNVKALYISPMFEDETDVFLEDGEWFSQNDYCISDSEDIFLPVILGSQYKEFYQVGDAIKNACPMTEQPMTLKVVGFLQEGSCFYNANSEKIVLDSYMLLPHFEVSGASQYAEDGSISDLSESAYGLFSNKVMDARIFCSSSSADMVKAQVYQIFNENGLYELRLSCESDAYIKSLESAKSMTVTCGIISAFIILLTVIMFCLLARYEVLREKRKYSVLQMLGMTKWSLFCLMCIESLSVFLLSDFLYLIIYGFYLLVLDISLGLTLQTALLILASKLVLLMFIGIFASRQIMKLNMSSVLREHE